MVDWLDVSDEDPRVAYTATAGQTVFPVPFAFFENGDLVVTVDDVAQDLDTDYAVTGALNEDGGTVTFVTGLTGGETVVVYLDIPLSLTTHQPTGGPLDIPGLNLQHSRIIAMIKQVASEIERGLLQPGSDAEAMDPLPSAADRASKYLFFDADGNPTAVSSVSTSVAATAFWVTMVQTADAPAARSALGIGSTDTLQSLFNSIHFR